MNKYKVAFFSLVSAVFAVAITLGFVAYKKPDQEANLHYSKHIQANYKIFTLPLPEELNFAGENVPLDQFDVRERMDRELLVNTYWQSNTLLGIKRAHRWFPVIEPILRANGVPDDFKYLALIESNLTNAVSPSGATGFWQFLDGTAKEYGLLVNDEVDERYHVEKSTQAACAYLNAAYKRYNSWPMVAASYNMGMGGLDRQVDRQGNTNYWDLLLNEETGRYVFRMLAMKEIMNNLDRYGFVVRPADLYEPLTYKTITVNTAIDDFASFAKSNNVSYKVLKLYNPWLRQPFLKNKDGRTFEVKLPD
jgi:membrane-bound lytic murein transglycosylase D